MAQSIVELVASIVTAHAQTTKMSTEELLKELAEVHQALSRLEGMPTEVGDQAETVVPLNWKQSIKGNEIICLVCGKGGMKALARHLKDAHQIMPKEYRKQFGIPSGTALAAKKFSAARRQMAMDRGLGDVLAKAREVRMSKLAEKKQAASPSSAKTAKVPASKSGKASVESKAPEKKVQSKKK